jgi:hypothetical protein
MSANRRVRLTEQDTVEGGIRCPACGTYTSLTDIIATGHCRGGWRGACDAELLVDLVVRE